MPRGAAVRKLQPISSFVTGHMVLSRLRSGLSFESQGAFATQ